MALSLDCPRCVLFKTCSSLGVRDLCSLDATSKKTLAHLDNPGEKPNVWLQVASEAGLCLVGADKVSIKSVLGVVLSKHISQRPETLVVSSHRSAQEISKAVQNMQYMRTKHLKDGGRIAEAFVTQFHFTREAVEQYVADPDRPVSSIPIRMAMAGNAMMKVVLTWYEGTMWLSMRQTGPKKRPFQPFAIELRTVSSPLTMRKDFMVWRPFNEQRFRGHGLCCMLGSSSAFAENMRGGILCTGFVHDAVNTGAKPCALIAALQLDGPALTLGCTCADMDTDVWADTTSDYETSDSEGDL